MILDFLDPAKFEYIESIKYYNRQREGLGFDFDLAVKDALNRILEYPEAWVMISERTHRCLVKRFPYGIIYQIRDDTVLVVAVHHLRRDPDLWKSRLSARFG
ncbi:MAG: type II toxin-antitoxin system RelE/ParE family toxin [Kiritimatiellae bacterium]|jgi:hypothetical protein|nr:type II toxin-antitoxin system RelE/ParE family toxin [Kiritimatiellia bacterium]